MRRRAVRVVGTAQPAAPIRSARVDLLFVQGSIKGPFRCYQHRAGPPAVAGRVTVATLCRFWLGDGLVCTGVCSHRVVRLGSS